MPKALKDYISSGPLCCLQNVYPPMRPERIVHRCWWCTQVPYKAGRNSWGPRGQGWWLDGEGVRWDWVPFAAQSERDVEKGGRSRSRLVMTSCKSGDIVAMQAHNTRGMGASNTRPRIEWNKRCEVTAPWTSEDAKETSQRLGQVTWSQSRKFTVAKSQLQSRKM